MRLSQRFFFSRARVGADTAPPATEALEEALRGVLARVRDAFPDLVADDGDVVEELAAHMGPLDGDLGSALAQLHAADLHLACACARGSTAALARFEELFVAQVPRWIARVDRSPAFADEVCQKLREAMLVARPPAAPKLSSYTGRGPLAGWLRVAAIRTALNLRRATKAGRNPGGIAASADLAPGAMGRSAPDPELDYLKSKYKEEFREAFVGALSRLSAEERSALRFHYLDGLSLDATAAACRVHRATAARWLARARESILADTRKLLVERLHVGGEELESVFRLVESQLEVSMHRYLNDPGPVVASS